MRHFNLDFSVITVMQAIPLNQCILLFLVHFLSAVLNIMSATFLTVHNQTIVKESIIIIRLNSNNQFITTDEYGKTRNLQGVLQGNSRASSFAEECHCK